MKVDKQEILNLLDAVESNTLVGSERTRLAQILREILQEEEDKKVDSQKRHSGV